MGRHLDERLALSMPRLTRALANLVLALPPSSSARRRALKRISARVWAALSRGDDEVVLLAFDPEIEFNIIGAEPDLLGLADRYHGHAGWLQFIERWRAEWTGSQLIHTPKALIDLGDRVVTRMTVTAQGATSGADVAQTMGIVSWLADGAVARQDNYWEWSDCVEALGLDAVGDVSA
jgi:ketosteroid isomerase-like protein